MLRLETQAAFAYKVVYILDGTYRVSRLMIDNRDLDATET
jgi:hypothetical protein